MTTERLYYDDSYTTQFSAHVIEQIITDQNAPAIILDRTYFYPTGGGQPFDTGTVNGVSVVDVYTRDDDKAVVHVLSEPVSATEVQAEVNWSRRFDHMQHHTGQHILTQAFVQIAGINTVGFHLGLDSVTVDLDTPNLTEQVVNTAEDLANLIVYENQAVTINLRDIEDQDGVRIRRIPRHLLTEGLRVVEIGSFDTTACGGTHVTHTGEIGVIKILKIEKRGTKTRVEFRCGGRALLDYRTKNRIANELSTQFNWQFTETPQLIIGLREDLKTSQSALKEAVTQLIDYEAAQLLNTAAYRDGMSIIHAGFEQRDVSELKLLASKIVTNPKTIALIGSVGGDKAQVFFARSPDLPHDMGKLLKETLAPLGGRGGGQPNFAQGGGIALELATLQKLLYTTANSIK